MVELRVPALGESVVEGTVRRWLKREGEAVARDEVVVEVDTDKITVEVAAPQAGVLARIAKPEGEVVRVGEVLGEIDETAVPAAAPAGAAGPADGTGAPAEAAATAAPTMPPPASPAVRALAAEHGVDLATLTGSGPGGRLTREDVLRAVAAGPGPAAPAPTTPPPSPGPAAPLAVADGRREERVPMSRRRQTIARRLVEAQQTTASLTTFNEVDLSRVLELRRRYRGDIEKRYGVRLGLMSFFTKAVVGALKAFPYLNAEIQGTEIVLKRYYDIGIAVGTDEGLVVPVVRDADRKSFVDIEREIADLAERARAGKLRLEELQGGTFTITNGGVYGSLLSTPILNPPQVGILGMHKVMDRPVVVDGQVVVRPMMYLALTYDHRIVDGSDAVRFLVRVKELLEAPERLLLEA